MLPGMLPRPKSCALSLFSAGGRVTRSVDRVKEGVVEAVDELERDPGS
jgi:hypothetical protein